MQLAVKFFAYEESFVHFEGRFEIYVAVARCVISLEHEDGCRRQTELRKVWNCSAVWCGAHNKTTWVECVRAEEVREVNVSGGSSVAHVVKKRL